MFITRNKQLFIGITVLIFALALGAIGRIGLKSGIDFTGGSSLEAEYTNGMPDISLIQTAAESSGISPVIVQTAGARGVLVRAKNLSDVEHQALVAALSGTSASSTGIATSSGFVEKGFTSLGPIIGKELRTRSAWAIGLVILLIVSYITFAFRAVSRPIASWKYGFIAVITLIHDVLVPAGYAAFSGIEVDVLFVTALLAILGFSIHDTIVVFDRIRENLRGAGKKDAFEETVGKSLSQTFTRSVNTSLTVILGLLILYFVGGESTRNFSLILIIGITAGTYSSVFFASPLLVALYDWQERGKK